MPAIVGYIGLFVGVAIYMAGAVLWDFGATSLDVEDIVDPTQKDFRLGVIAAAAGVIIVALSLWRIFVHWWDLYKYYSN